MDALATATSAMAIGVLNAGEHQATQEDGGNFTAIPNGENAQRQPADAGLAAASMVENGSPAPQAEHVSLPDAVMHPGQSTSGETILDPAALTARIA